MRFPSHTTVVAYLALFVAIGGSAYAVSKIGSSDIRDHSIRGKDVAANTLGGQQIEESSLRGPVASNDEQSSACDLPTGVAIDCIGTAINLPRKSAVLIIATADKGADEGSGTCVMNVDGAESNRRFLGSGPYRDGFAMTKVTSPLPPGIHNLSMRCTESVGNLSIEDPTIAAVAVNSP